MNDLLNTEDTMKKKIQVWQHLLKSVIFSINGLLKKNYSIYTIEFNIELWMIEEKDDEVKEYWELRVVSFLFKRS